MHIILIFFIFFTATGAHSATVQIPEWFVISVALSAPPELGRPLDVKVNLRALIGNHGNIGVRLILPESWKSEPETISAASLKEGTSQELTFAVIPGSHLSQGSIVAEVTLKAPKTELIEKIRRDFPEDAAAMAAAVNEWPAESKLYADVAFALFAEESFYPLAGDMWLAYADNLSPEQGFRGPSFFEDSLISAHQAQTDVEMYEKLQGFLQADPTFADKLAESGIDINRKRHDYLHALYVLAVKAWQAERFSEAFGFVEQAEKQLDPEKTGSLENLKIATVNLKGLIFWSQGQKRLAEDAFKKAFYANRKHSLQRYVLRNIGLLMVSNRDRDTAAQMFNLALPLKRGFTLLEKEADLLKKN
jgi:tetratricopeptide (TPR) repeat protein